MAAPGGHEVADGMTFIVGDGTTDVILEYNDPTLRNGVIAGHVPVNFNPLDTPADMANEISAVINSNISGRHMVRYRTIECGKKGSVYFALINFIRPV